MDYNLPCFQFKYCIFEFNDNILMITLNSTEIQVLIGCFSLFLKSFLAIDTIFSPMHFYCYSLCCIGLFIGILGSHIFLHVCRPHEMDMGELTTLIYWNIYFPNAVPIEVTTILRDHTWLWWENLVYWDTVSWLIIILSDIISLFTLFLQGLLWDVPNMQDIQIVTKD